MNALADLHACNYVFLLEARKHGQDLYLWLARAPNGPTIKFSVGNVHTMGELGFGGNCLKGGRGVVVFDKSFEDGFEKGAAAMDKQLTAEGIRHEYHLYQGDHSLEYFLSHLGETMEFHSRAFHARK